MKTGAPLHSRRRGMVMMEMLAAIALFGIMVTALMQGLTQIAQSAALSRTELRMLLRLQSELNRYSKWPRIQEFENQDIPESDKVDGVWTKTRITKLEDIQNMEKQPLQDMYEIVVTAYSDNLGNGEIHEQSASTLRYARLYSATGAAAGQVATPHPMNTSFHPATPPRRGFTIIEVVLGLALLSILIGGVFSVLKGTMDVSADVVTEETKTLRAHSFCELLRRSFEQMPGNARVNLQNYTGGSDMLEVSFTDYPLAFSWPGVQAGAKTVLFRTERERSGGLGLQAAIIYLDEEQSQEWQKGKFDETKGLGRITIMGGIASLRWRFFNDQTQEYEEEWPLTKTQRPTFVEMSLAFMDNSDPITLVFWIPTMANPTQFTNFAGQGGAGGGGGTPPPIQPPKP